MALFQDLIKRRRLRHSLAGLRQLSDHELEDMGISRPDLYKRTVTDWEWGKI